MKEFLGENLEPLWDKLHLDVQCTYQGRNFEVWTASEDEFELMCNMDDEVFENICPNGWWRSADGSNMGDVNGEAIINGHHIYCWDTRDFEAEHDVFQCRYLTTYFSCYIGASMADKVVALAVDLAKANNMTMTELFQKYEG